jgi:hypothetical protein
MAVVSITGLDQPRQADHRAVIAWERHMRETAWPAMATTWTGRCSARSPTTANRRCRRAMSPDAMDRVVRRRSDAPLTARPGVSGSTGLLVFFFLAKGSPRNKLRQLCC